MPLPVYRSQRVVLFAQRAGIRRKVCAIQIRPDGDIFVDLCYFNPPYSLLGRYLIAAPPGVESQLHLQDAAKASKHRYKFVYHASGQCHFSLTKKVVPHITTQSVPLGEKDGHVFTVHLAGLQSFTAFHRDDRPAVGADRTMLPIPLPSDPKFAAKVVGFWHPASRFPHRYATVPAGPVSENDISAWVHAIDDGVPRGFILGPPEHAASADHVLVVTFAAFPWEPSAQAPYLLCVGGFLDEQDANGDDAGLSLIAAMFTDRTATIDDLTWMLGTVDLS